MTYRRFSVFLLAMLMAVVLCACGGTSTQKAPAAESEGSASVSSAVAEPVEEEPVVAEPEYISYPGFANRWFDDENKEFIMSNSEENTVSFIFELKDSKGKVLYTSEAVAAGDDATWDVTQCWTEGKHELSVSATPVLANGELGNTITQTITVSVNE